MGLLHNWNIVTEGYMLFRRDRKWEGGRRRVFALSVSKWIDCKELPLRKSHENVESL